MLLIGLTGGIGMGKSTVAEILGEMGEQIIDTDELARQLVEPGEPALAEIQAAFGNDVIRQDGRLDRAALAGLVFKDAAKRTRLEAILHPRIRAAWLERAGEWRARGERRGIVVIPLLFETGAEREFDLTICVGCSPRTQAARLTERGWSGGQIRDRVAAQRPISEKMDRADRVIWNESTLEICRMQVERIVQAI